MERYWLRLFPDTFLWSKNGQSLIYNVKNKISFCIENTDRVKELTDQLLDLLNLYCVELSEEDLGNSNLKKFIGNVKSISSGEIIKAIEGEPKPIVLVPILNLQSDVERLRKDSPLSVGEHVLNYLHSVTLYLDNSVPCDNPYFYKFTDRPRPDYLLEFKKINKFLNNIEVSAIGQINIVSERVTDYPEFDLLINELDRLHLKKNFHVNDSSFEHNLQLLNFLISDQYYLTIFVNNNFKRKKIEAIVSLIGNNKKQVEWQFFITSEKEYKLVAEVIEELNLGNTNIKPLYTGQNLQFFENHIYLTEEDLQYPGLNRREVFAHQALNTNDFGKFIVMPDGKVYANLYHEPLGTIDDDARELVYKEIDHGISWRRIRDMKPCCECVYQWLCPSPSNYELAIGKPNLCHIKR